MDKRQISAFLAELAKTKDRNLVIVDFANVDRWQDSLGWPVGIKKLGQLVRNVAKGKQFLRRFYYGLDFGSKEKSTLLLPWSKTIYTQASYSGFEVVTRRVKYIPDHNYSTGFIKKCNLDIEMVVDLLKEEINYDTVLIFSGDGDLAYALEYIHKKFGKTIYVFGARDHVGKELIDAQTAGIIKNIIFVEDFEYRLNLDRKST